LTKYTQAIVKDNELAQKKLLKKKNHQLKKNEIFEGHTCLLISFQ
jgi:hypothetical protein